MGRVDRYSTHVEPYLDDISRWKTTMTEEQISDKLGIAHSTFQKYKQQHDELNRICLYGNKKKCDRVWSAVQKKAEGYTELLQKEVLDKDGNIITVLIPHHVPPDMKAAALILANNDPSFHVDDSEVLKLKKEIAELKKKLAESDGDWECLP
jgi:hypothetical protein